MKDLMATQNCIALVTKDNPDRIQSLTVLDGFQRLINMQDSSSIEKMETECALHAQEPTMVQELEPL